MRGVSWDLTLTNLFLVIVRFAIAIRPTTSDDKKLCVTNLVVVNRELNFRIRSSFGIKSSFEKDVAQCPARGNKLLPSLLFCFVSGSLAPSKKEDGAVFEAGIPCMA